MLILKIKCGTCILNIDFIKVYVLFYFFIYLEQNLLNLINRTRHNYTANHYATHSAKEISICFNILFNFMTNIFFYIFIYFNELNKWYVSRRLHQFHFTFIFISNLILWFLFIRGSNNGKQPRCSSSISNFMCLLYFLNTSFMSCLLPSGTLQIKSSRYFLINGKCTDSLGMHSSNKSSGTFQVGNPFWFLKCFWKIGYWTWNML